MANRRLAATIAALFTATAWATPAVAQEPEPVAVEPPALDTRATLDPAASSDDGGAPPVEHAAVPTNEHGWIDTSDRDVVLQSFVEEYFAELPAPNYTGDVSVCRSGTIAPEYRAAFVSRINWYRAMAGAGEPFADNSHLSRKAQATAMWASRNWKQNGSISDRDPCYTTIGHEGRWNSDVVIGIADPFAADYFLLVGHDSANGLERREFLDPDLTEIGVGVVPVAAPEYRDDPIPASVFHFGSVDYNRPDGPTREAGRIVTWPPSGFVPSSVIPEVWSVTATGYSGPSIRADKIEVWVDGQPVAVENLGRGRFAPDVPELPIEDVDVRVVATREGPLAPAVEHEWTTTIAGLRPKGGVPYQRARSVYRTVTPCRVADTRRGFERRFGPNEMDTVQVTGDGPIFEIQGATPGGCGIPADATAVEATLTAVNPSTDGYARVGAALDVENPNANLLSYTAGRNRSVSSTIPLSPGATGHLALWNVRGSTDYAVDVHGYYVPEAQPGLKNTPVTPCRTADTRQAGGALGTSTNRAVQITGTCGVPANAEAVKTTITAVPTSTRTGYLRTWASQTSIPNASFLQHHRKGETVTNTGNVAIGSNGKIALGNRGGSSHYTVDVLGYYAPDGELTYTPIQACRAVDTRTGVGTFGARRRAFEVVGTSDSADDRAAFVAQGGDADTCDVPTTATAVDTTVTALDPVGSGYAIVWPSMTRQPKVRALNYRSTDWTSNNVTVPTGNQQRIALANVGGTTNYLLELTGYYEP